MRRVGLISLGILITLLLTLFLISGFPPKPVKQLAGRDATDFADNRLLLFITLIAALSVGVGVVGGGLAFLFWRLSREVTVAKEQKPEPVDPLSYRTYGHSLAVGLPIVLGFGVLGVLLTSQMLPVEATTEAEVTDNLFKIEFTVISLIFGLVVGLFVHFLLYYRAAPDDLSDGKHIHGHNGLEVMWTVIPLIFVMILGGYTWTKLHKITEPKDGEIGVQVIGFQWGWQFVYPTDMFFTEQQLAELDPRQLADIERAGGITSPDLVLLQNQTVRLEMHSIDVIHSFWIPEMRVKQDVVPGVETTLRYTPILPGTYRIRCAELCGLNHWQMYANTVVLSTQEYKTWIANTRASYGNPIDAGYSIYVQRCQTCHSIDGSRKTGPTWKNLVGSERQFEDAGPMIADFAYVQQSIWNPNAEIVRGFEANLMPNNFRGLLSELQTEQIFAYMCTLLDPPEKANDISDCVRVLPQDEETPAEGETIEETGNTDTTTDSNTTDTDTVDNTDTSSDGQ